MKTISNKLKYDHFYNDFPLFIKQLEEAIGIRLSQRNKRRLHAFAKQPFANVSDKPENIYSHHRSGKSKQYLDKLSPQTVERLNDILHETLEYWEF